MNRKLTIVSPLELPENELAFRRGFDGAEPLEIVAWYNEHRNAGYGRFCFAINTYYEKLYGRHYENSALRLLIQRSLQELGYAAVSHETLPTEGECPDELDGVLDIFDKCALVQSGEIVGQIILWSASTGSRFLDDAVVFDLLSDSATETRIRDGVLDACKKFGVAFQVHDDADATPRQSGRLSRLWSTIWR